MCSLRGEREAGARVQPEVWTRAADPLEPPPIPNPLEIDGTSRPDSHHFETIAPSDLVLAWGVLAQGLPVSRHSRVPWRRLFRKPAVWAAVISQLSAACSFFVLISWLPTFFKETFPDAKVSGRLLQGEGAPRRHEA